MKVTFACGHVVEITDDSVPPECPTCHETRVQRVDAPAPRFRGSVSGPSAVPIVDAK